MQPGWGLGLVKCKLVRSALVLVVVAALIKELWMANLSFNR